MTYCPTAIRDPRRLDLWVELQKDYLQNRLLMATAATFRKYRCHNGEQSNGHYLGDTVAVLMCLPTWTVPLLVWNEGKCDIADSIHKFLEVTSGNLLTLAAFKCELEVDIADRSLQMSGS